MRLQGDDVNAEFFYWLNQLSYDPAMNGLISLPEYIRQVPALAELYEQVFPQAEMQTAHCNPEFFCSCEILTPFNEISMEMNKQILDWMQRELYKLFGENTAEVEDSTLQKYSTESLQDIRLAGLPLSTLELKIGAPVMLLRNLDQSNSLNNGSQMIISQMGRKVIAEHLQGGDYNEELWIIPCIPLTSLEGELVFLLTRWQFPIRLCFAMTINKSQGQSLKNIGLDLRSPVFTHRQLYVALSRTTNVNNLTVLLPDRAKRKTANIVYPEVLQHMRKNRDVTDFVAGLESGGDIDMNDI